MEGIIMDVEPHVALPKVALESQDMGLLINSNDAYSKAVGAHYAKVRHIPDAHILRVALPVTESLNASAFQSFVGVLNATVPPTVQAYALAWRIPFGVCEFEGRTCDTKMSITSALTLGFNAKWYEPYCTFTGTSPLFRSPSIRYFTDLGMRPAMALAATSVELAVAMIDRAVAADGSRSPSDRAGIPSGLAGGADGFMFRTTDRLRSCRWREFVATAAAFDGRPSAMAAGVPAVAVAFVDASNGTALPYLNGSAPQRTPHFNASRKVDFYFESSTNVPGLATVEFAPGAIADTLTSFSGRVPASINCTSRSPGSPQISVQCFLEAGAAASHGTVREPCAVANKWADPEILIGRYVRGASALQAYAAAVQMAGEGLLVGDPLTTPWVSRSRFNATSRSLTITTTTLDPGVEYSVSGAHHGGPYFPVLTGIRVNKIQWTTISVENATLPFYRLDAGISSPTPPPLPPPLQCDKPPSMPR
jgi:hypothetical protein